MNKRIVIGIVLVGIATAAIYGWSEYSRKPAGADELQASVVIAVDPLIEAFTADEVAATTTYADAVIQVSGPEQEVTAERKKVNVLLTGTDPVCRVTCEFDAAIAPEWSAGNEVTVNGVCTGIHRLRWLLQRCTPVTE